MLNFRRVLNSILRKYFVYLVYGTLAKSAKVTKLSYRVSNLESWLFVSGPRILLCTRDTNQRLFVLLNQNCRNEYNFKSFALKKYVLQHNTAMKTLRSYCILCVGNTEQPQIKLS